MNFLKSFAKFSIGTWISAGISIFSTPILTWFIKPEEFGKSSMFVLAYSLLTSLLCFSLDQGFCRYFNEKIDNERPSLLASSLLLPFLGCLIGILGIEIFKYDLLNILFSSKEEIIIIRILQISIPIGVISKFTNASLRMQLNASFYSIVQIFTAVLNVAITLIYAHYISSSYYAILAGFIISQFGGVFMSIFLDFKFWRKAMPFLILIDKKTIKDLFVYSLPFVPIFLIDWLFQGLDRTFLRIYSNFFEIGLYATATKISYSLNIIQSGFTTFWVPFSYEKYHKEPESISIYSVIFNGFAICFGIIILSILLFQKLILLVISAEYVNVVNIFPVLLLIPMMYTLSEITVVGINFKKQTKLHLYIIIISLLINLVFAYLLIPNLGALGAAISMAVGYLIFFILRTLIAKKYYDVKVNIKKFFATLSILLIPIISSMINFTYTEVLCVFSLLLLLVTYKNDIKVMILALKNNQLSV